MRSGEVAEVLRIHSVPTFASLWLMPRLPGFRAQHPQLRVQLDASHGEIDFARGAIDVAICYGTVRGRDLHIETLFSEEIMPMISPALKAKLDIRTPEDLLTQDLILSELTLVQWPHWFSATAFRSARTATASHSIARPWSWMPPSRAWASRLDSNRTAEAALKRGDLVPVFEDLKGMPVRAHHLVYPRACAQWDRVVSFTHWLRAEAEKVD